MKVAKSLSSIQLGPWCRWLLVILVMGVQAAFPVEIIAHRGASNDAPENTLPAVLLGWERGADAVEIDIHQTQDGRIVAFHDRDAVRITGHEGLIAEMQFQELRKLDAGQWKDPSWKGTRIPLLEEVLDTVPVGKTLVIEIKCPSSVLPELERVLVSRGNRQMVIFIAFDYETIVATKKRFPDRKAYWLYSFSTREDQHYGIQSISDLVKRVEQGKLDGLDVRYSNPQVAELVQLLQKIDKKLYVYTVNDPDEARNLQKMGVAGITTDRPGFLRTVLASH